MTTSSSQPPDLGQYLARRGFTPSPGNRGWLGRGTGQQIIRVFREPGEATLLICLTPRSVRLYQAIFSPGTPGAVIIAAIEAALSRPPPPDRPGAGPGRSRSSGARANESDPR